MIKQDEVFSALTVVSTALRLHVFGFCLQSMPKSYWMVGVRVGTNWVFGTYWDLVGTGLIN